MLTFLTQANGMILLVWATAIMFSVFPLVGWNRYVSEVNLNFKNMYHSFYDSKDLKTYLLFQLYMIFHFQSCLMGCAFDFYSPGWHYRSYVIVLLFVFYIFPLLIIFGSYIGIFQNNRSSRKDLQRIIRKNTSNMSKKFKKKTQSRSNHFRGVSRIVAFQ